MAVRSAPPERVSRVRRLPLPVTEPPFDDELDLVVLGGDPRASAEPPAPGTPVQGVLALELEPGDEFEELLRPIGLGAPATADSLWLRDPGAGHVPAALLRARRPGATAEHASGPGRTSARGGAVRLAGDPGNGRTAEAPVRAGITAGRRDRPGSPDHGAHAGAAGAAGAAPVVRATGRVGPPGTTSQVAAARTSSPTGDATAQPGGASTTGEVPRPGTNSPAGGTGSTSRARGADPGHVDQHGGTGQVGDPRSGRQAGSRAGQTGAATTDPRAEAGPGVRRRLGEAGGRGGGADDLPDPRRWVARLTQSAIECLHGRRPVQQLVRWTAEPVYRDLTRRASTTEAAPAERPRIRSLRVCRITASVAEASVVVQLGRAARSVAVAVRLEADDGRWVCTAFDLVEPGPAAARRQTQPGQRAAHASSNATA